MSLPDWRGAGWSLDIDAPQYGPSPVCRKCHLAVCLCEFSREDRNVVIFSQYVRATAQKLLIPAIYVKHDFPDSVRFELDGTRASVTKFLHQYGEKQLVVHNVRRLPIATEEITLNKFVAGLENAMTHHFEKCLGA